MFLRRLGFLRAGGVYAAAFKGDGSIGDSLPASGTERGEFSSAMFIFL